MDDTAKTNPMAFFQSVKSEPCPVLSELDRLEIDRDEFLRMLGRSLLINDQDLAVPLQNYLIHCAEVTEKKLNAQN